MPPILHDGKTASQQLTECATHRLDQHLVPQRSCIWLVQQLLRLQMFTGGPCNAVFRHLVSQQRQHGQSSARSPVNVNQQLTAGGSAGGKPDRSQISCTAAGRAPPRVMARTAAPSPPPTRRIAHGPPWGAAPPSPSCWAMCWPASDRGPYTRGDIWWQQSNANASLMTQALLGCGPAAGCCTGELWLWLKPSGCWSSGQNTLMVCKVDVQQSPVSVTSSHLCSLSAAVQRTMPAPATSCSPATGGGGNGWRLTRLRLALLRRPVQEEHVRLQRRPVRLHGNKTTNRS